MSSLSRKIEFSSVNLKVNVPTSGDEIHQINAVFSAVFANKSLAIQANPNYNACGAQCQVSNWNIRSV